MALTLRLDPGLDRAVTEMAAAERISKQQLLIRAVREYTERHQRIARTVRNADRVIAENQGLLGRLAQ